MSITLKTLEILFNSLHNYFWFFGLTLFYKASFLKVSQYQAHQFDDKPCISEERNITYFLTKQYHRWPFSIRHLIKSSHLMAIRFLLIQVVRWLKKLMMKPYWPFEAKACFNLVCQNILNFFKLVQQYSFVML